MKQNRIILDRDYKVEFIGRFNLSSFLELRLMDDKQINKLYRFVKQQIALKTI